MTFAPFFVFCETYKKTGTVCFFWGGNSHTGKDKEQHYAFALGLVSFSAFFCLFPVKPVQLTALKKSRAITVMAVFLFASLMCKLSPEYKLRWGPECRAGHGVCLPDPYWRCSVRAINAPTLETVQQHSSALWAKITTYLHFILFKNLCLSCRSVMPELPIWPLEALIINKGTAQCL